VRRELAQGLRLHWSALCSTLKVPSALQNHWWTLLETRYTEPQRHYHTLAHLNELYSCLQEFKEQIVDIPAVELAIFFHDIIYNPRATDGKNEDDSAILFGDFAQDADLDSGLTAKVFRWIVQTKHHVCSPDDEGDCKLFMDFDMAVLGWPRQQYNEYRKQVRNEYIHIPAGIFCSARASFLAATASQAQIFATDAFRERLEQRARENLLWESQLLQDTYQALGLLPKLVSSLFSLSKRYRTMLHGVVAAGGTCGACTVAALPGPRALVLELLGRPLQVMVPLSCASIVVPTGCYLAFGAPVVRFPYPTVAAGERKGTVVYAGSFNPPHLGHLAMIKHLTTAHEKVYVVIGVNPRKHQEVSPYVRRALLQQMLLPLSREQQSTDVEVRVISGYVWRFGLKVGAIRLYRGIRSWSKDGKEEKFLELLNIFGPPLLARRLPIRTGYIIADPRYAHVSSTLLRKLLGTGDPGFEELVPPGSAKAVRDAYGYLSAL